MVKIKVISKVILLLILFTSCSNVQKQNNSKHISNDLKKYKKLVNLKFSPIEARWTLEKLSASRNEEKPYCIYSIIKLKSEDKKFIDSIVTFETDIQDKIYINKTKINYPIFKALKIKAKKEGDFYKLNQAVYPINLITKNLFLKGYFLIVNKHYLFVTVCEGD
jgi:hypothetical protein